MSRARVVSRDDETIFVYAGSREEAERARAVVEAELREAGAHGAVSEPERWLPDEERWTGEPPSEYEPLSATLVPPTVAPLAGVVSDPAGNVLSTRRFERMGLVPVWPVWSVATARKS